MQPGLEQQDLIILTYLIKNFDWAHTIYGHVQEIILDDIPDPLGKSVTTTTKVDANLNHCFVTGRSVTGCLHFVNHTPIDSYSKRQATVETATYGLEIVSSKDLLPGYSSSGSNKSGLC